MPPEPPPSWPEDQPLVFSEDRKRLSVSAPRPARAIVDLVKWLDAAQIEIEDLHIKRPTLEDVFIHLTGKTLRD